MKPRNVNRIFLFAISHIQCLLYPFYALDKPSGSCNLIKATLLADENGVCYDVIVFSLGGHVFMRMGIAQIRPRLGRIDHNLELHRQMIQQAKEEQIDLLVFPELSLTGYNLLDLTFDVARRTQAEEIQTLVQLTGGIDVVFGFVEESHDYQLYNSAIYASQQSITYIHRKVYLPTYGMFDEARYFGRGKRIRSFATRFGRMGLLICEDAWHPSTTYLLTQDGAECLILLANSPAKDVSSEHFDSQKTWSLLTQSQATVSGTYYVYANRVGTEDGVTFSGGSHVVNPLGKMEQQGENFAEQLLIYDLDMDEVRRARFQLPVLRDEDHDLTLRELKRIQNDRIEGEDRSWK